MNLLPILLALLLLGCGPTGKSEQAVEPLVSSVESVDAGALAVSDASVAQEGLSEDDCQRLFDHIFEVVFTRQQASLPPEQRPTDDDLRVAKDALRAELFRECPGASRATFPYECAMAADTAEDFQACVGQK